MSRRRWRPQEALYLEASWGCFAVRAIAARLGRSVRAVRERALRQKLLMRDSGYMTRTEVVTAFGYAEGSVRGVFKRWRANGLQAQASGRVTAEAFWEWARANTAMLPWARLAKGALGPEPEWVEAARASTPIPPSLCRRFWTAKELAGADRLLREAEPLDAVSARLGRTSASVRSALYRYRRRQGPERRKGGRGR